MKYLLKAFITLEGFTKKEIIEQVKSEKKHAGSISMDLLKDIQIERVK